MAKIKAIDVSLETALLRNFSSKETYIQYIQFLDLKRLLPNTSLLLKDYAKYFKEYEDQQIDWGKFYTQFAQNWHVKDLEEQDVEYYRDYVFPAIQACTDKDVEKCMQGLIQKQHVDAIEKSVHDGLDVSKLRNIIDTYEKTLTKSGEIDEDARTLLTVDFSILDKANGIPWFMPSLQRGLLSLTQGQFVVVSADFGTGKSAFVISQLTHTLKWLNKNNDKRPILFFNSEGCDADVLARMLSCLYKDKCLGGFEEIVEKWPEIVNKFTEGFSPEQVIVYQIATTPDFKTVERKIKKHSPALVIIDITDRLAPEGDVNGLKTLYDDLRVLSGVTCPIIGTSQSGDTSYFDEKAGSMKNKKWLSGANTYGSKTGKPGAADTIITIGKADEDSMLRFISTPKKKRGEAVKITAELEPRFSYFRELEM